MKFTCEDGSQWEDDGRLLPEFACIKKLPEPKPDRIAVMQEKVSALGLSCTTAEIVRLIVDCVLAILKDEGVRK